LSKARRNFEAVVREHQSMVFSIALRITGDRGVAEEVAQDVFFELYRRLERLESEDHVTSWLRRVAVHRSIDASRRAFRRHEASAETIDLATEPGSGDPLLARRLRHLVAQLPEHMRVVIVLRYQEDLMPAEIAEILKMPVATVKSNLQRGLSLLRGRTEGVLTDRHGRT
jgi:RNA polymerase sigma-70 factor (ECF subfamily)